MQIVQICQEDRDTLIEQSTILTAFIAVTKWQIILIHQTNAINENKAIQG